MECRSEDPLNTAPARGAAAARRAEKPGDEGEVRS
jgi:hypothetical protein